MLQIDMHTNNTTHKMQVDRKVNNQPEQQELKLPCIQITAVNSTSACCLCRAPCGVERLVYVGKDSAKYSSILNMIVPPSRKVCLYHLDSRGLPTINPATLHSHLSARKKRRGRVRIPRSDDQQLQMK